MEDVVEGCGGTRAGRYVVEEEDEEEEEVLPLVRRERRIKAGGDIQSLTPSGLVTI